MLEYLPAGNQGKTQEKIKYLPVGKPKDTAGCKMLALRVQIQEASCRKTRWEKSSKRKIQSRKLVDVKKFLGKVLFKVFPTIV